MKLIPLPAFSDNYIWMLHDGHRAVVVDPGDAQPVFDAIRSLGVELDAILVTHHHADHTGGVDALRNATGASVYGPAYEKIPEPLTRLTQGESVTVLGLTFSVMEVPGHTSGHIAFYSDGVQLDGPDRTSRDLPVLFCGDTLFSGGCGRLFEGTPAQMLASLDSLAALPASTLVCCTHEYTLSNLKFARAVDPSNAALLSYSARCVEKREHGEPTLPSTIAIERDINPFLRSRSPSVENSVHQFDPAARDEVGVFAALRQWKNEFK